MQPVMQPVYQQPMVGFQQPVIMQQQPPVYRQPPPQNNGPTVINMTNNNGGNKN
jgi:hypothetical protein